jgi:hypothetical protein
MGFADKGEGEAEDWTDGAAVGGNVAEAAEGEMIMDA